MADVCCLMSTINVDLPASKSFQKMAEGHLGCRISQSLREEFMIAPASEGGRARGGGGGGGGGAKDQENHQNEEEQEVLEKEEQQGEEE